jgi:hypothetical protein
MNRRSKLKIRDDRMPARSFRRLFSIQENGLALTDPQNTPFPVPFIKIQAPKILPVKTLFYL